MVAPTPFSASTTEPLHTPRTAPVTVDFHWYWPPARTAVGPVRATVGVAGAGRVVGAAVVAGATKVAGGAAGAVGRVGGTVAIVAAGTVAGGAVAGAVVVAVRIEVPGGRVVGGWVVVRLTATTAEVDRVVPMAEMASSFDDESESPSIVT